MLALAACQEPISITCADGLVCPAGTQCAAHQDVCIKDSCGNGIVDPGEVCDDGNIKDGDGCSANCKSNETCGNHVVDVKVGEVCDDGNNTDGDGCSADCKSNELCGNGIVDTAVGEVCDDHNHTDGDGCSHDCLSNETCGNGYVDTVKGEVCDDGNNTDGDGCSGNCKSNETCGNHIIDTAAGEVCDDGNHLDGDGCSANCKSNETCGNHVVDTIVGEVCDPPGPGCSSDCRSTLQCGDHLLNPGEQCDDGGTVDTSTCNMDPLADLVRCHVPICGDGYKNVAAGEDCDTSRVDTNLCNGLTCKTPACGDSYTNHAAGEDCDTGGTTDTQICNMGSLVPTQNCKFPRCGDGYQNSATSPPEQCDTGLVDMPNCNGLTCTTPVCGDSYVNFAANEQCDTGGNTTDTFCNMKTAAGAVRCKLSTCGDGYQNVATNEECDTSGTDAAVLGGFCNADSCKLNVCGDAHVNSLAGEQCDLGNTTADTAQCNMGATAGTKRCKFPVCGDGYRNTVTEACDDARADNTHDCLQNCTVATCGDGFVDSQAGLLHEVCDDATRGQTQCAYGTANCVTCDADCQGTTPRTGPVCGDGIVNGPEVCDDHNLTCGSCNATCTQVNVGPAVGTITAVSANHINDGETFTLNDGFNTAVVFEFNKSGGITSGHVAVSVNGSDNADTVATSMKNAINGVGSSLKITAISSSATVSLTNDIAGSQGNHNILETVGNSGFIVNGMSGGGGYDCNVGDACTQDSDCLTEVCSSGACQANTFQLVAVTPVSLNAGASGSADVAVTTSSVWPSNGKMTVTFPAGFDVSGVTTCAVSGADGTCSVSVSSQTVTITRGGGATTTSPNTAMDVTIGPVVNPGVAGTTGAFSVTTTTNTGQLLDSGSAPGVGIIAGGLTSLTSASTNLAAGGSGNVTLGFKLANTWPGNGKVQFVFPAGFDVSGATTTCTVTGTSGGCTVAVSSQTLTISRTGGASAAGGTSVTVTVGPVVNPGVTGSSGTFGVTTTNNAGATIDQGTAPALTITAGALSAVSLVPASLAAGASGNVDVHFTTANQWPSNGKVAVAFAAGFDVSGVTTCTIAGATGTCSASAVGQTVTVTRGGASTNTNGGTAVTVTVGPVKNPGVSGNTATSTVTTQTVGSTTIDTGTAAAVAITAGALTAVSVTPASLNVTATGNVVVAFTTANSIPANGKVAVLFPAGFTVTGVSTCTPTGTGGTCSASGTSQTVTATLSGGSGTPASTAVTLTFNNITNPSSAGATGTFTVTTETNAAVAIDQGTGAAVTLVTGGLTAVSAVPVTLVAGASGNIAFHFTLATDWSTNGKGQVVFPAGYDISGMSTCTISSGTCTVAVAGQTATVSRTGAKINSGTAVTLTLGAAVNPGVSGTTGTFSITTQTNGGSTIDTGTATGVTITDGALTGTDVTPASLVAGATGNIVFAFHNANAWPGNGKLVLVFPAGFDVSTVTCGTVTGADGTCASVPSGQTVTVTRVGGTSTAPTNITVTLGSIRNPQVSGAAGTITMTTQNSSGTDIDTGSDSGITITDGALTVASVTPASLTNSTTNDVVVAFTNANPWPGSGKLVVVFPAGFDVSGVTCGAVTGADGNCSASVSSQTVTITRGGGSPTTTPGATAITVTLHTVVNPVATGATGTFDLTTETAGAAEIDTGTAASVTIN